MILYYGMCLLLALALLASLWAQVSAPNTMALEHGRLVIAEARVLAQATEIALLQPTPRSCTTGPPYYSSC